MVGGRSFWLGPRCEGGLRQWGRCWEGGHRSPNNLRRPNLVVIDLQLEERMPPRIKFNPTTRIDQGCRGLSYRREGSS